MKLKSLLFSALALSSVLSLPAHAITGAYTWWAVRVDTTASGSLNAELTELSFATDEGGAFQVYPVLAKAGDHYGAYVAANVIDGNSADTAWRANPLIAVQFSEPQAVHRINLQASQYWQPDNPRRPARVDILAGNSFGAWTVIQSNVPLEWNYGYATVTWPY